VAEDVERIREMRYPYKILVGKSGETRRFWMPTLRWKGHIMVNLKGVD
jgi:hypothetical protein